MLPALLSVSSQFYNMQIFKKVQIYKDGKMEKTFQKWQVQKEEQKIDVLYRWQKDELSSDVRGENEKLYDAQWRFTKDIIVFTVFFTS